jgi:P pilus assembly chaperone PapD
VYNLAFPLYCVWNPGFELPPSTVVELIITNPPLIRIESSASFSVRITKRDVSPLARFVAVS